MNIVGGRGTEAGPGFSYREGPDVDSEGRL